MDGPWSDTPSIPRGCHSTAQCPHPDTPQVPVPGQQSPQGPLGQLGHPGDAGSHPGVMELQELSPSIPAHGPAPSRATTSSWGQTCPQPLAAHFLSSQQFPSLCRAHFSAAFAGPSPPSQGWMDTIPAPHLQWPLPFPRFLLGAGIHPQKPRALLGDEPVLIYFYIYFYEVFIARAPLKTPEHACWDFSTSGLFQDAKSVSKAKASATSQGFAAGGWSWLQEEELGELGCLGASTAGVGEERREGMTRALIPSGILPLP